METTRVYIGLGSNIGDRIGHIQQAVKMLSDFDGIRIITTSSFYETEPYGLKEQAWFVNAVLELQVSISAVELLKICNSIEEKLGRKRTNQKWGPREIDLDILLYGEDIINDELLTIPHPATYERAYCVVPMLEIAKNIIHPKLKKKISEIYQEIEEPEQVFLYGTAPHEII